MPKLSLSTNQRLRPRLARAVAGPNPELKVKENRQDLATLSVFFGSAFAFWNITFTEILGTDIKKIRRLLEMPDENKLPL